LSKDVSPIEAAARRYHDAGLCVLPARRAEKRPAVGAWKQYQKRLPTAPELDAWLANNPDAICILCGAVSNHAEMIDFDGNDELFWRWWERIPAHIRDRLVVETTPAGGLHVIYLCLVAICGNLKLAQRKVNGKIITLIETRGEGGLFLCAPTPGYALIQGDFTNLPTLTAAERDILLQAAWELNEYVPPVVDGPRCATTMVNVGQMSASSATMSELSAENGPMCDGAADNGRGANHHAERPGDDFNHRGDPRKLLEQHGWVQVSGGDNEYWRRPGKDSGWSATLKDGVFYVFSSNAAPFEPNRAYSPFSVLTLLEHGGDFEQAARSLRSSGYGGDPPPETLAGVDISGIVEQGADVRAHGEASELTDPAASLAVTAPKQTSGVRLTRADLIEMRPPQWLLRGMLERDTFALVFGDPGCGKSFLAIDWACRIATGTPWRGHAVKGGPVIYIAGEGQLGFGRRIRAWSEHHGVSLTGIPLYVAPAVAITEPGQLIQLATAIDAEAGQPSLIILDTLARCFGGGDENATQDMSRFVSACDALRRRYSCTILVVHHTGHGDKSRARGAIALKAALDAEYRLANDHSLLLTATKMKDAETPAPLTMQLTTVDLPGLADDYGNPVTSAAIEVCDADTAAIVSKVNAAMAGMRGKWQTIGLNIAHRLAACNEDGQVPIDTWRDQCSEAGMVRQNQHRVLQALSERGDLVVTGELLRVVPG